MKKMTIFVFAAALMLLVTVTACTTAMPLQRDGATEVPIHAVNYEVLGRVKIEDNVMQIKLLPFLHGKHVALYYKLFEAAQAQYPGAEDLLNITVDYEGKNILFFEMGKYVTTGLAIKYTSSN